MDRSVLGLVVRSEVRRSWRSLLALALIVGFVGTVVLAAGAGARRTSSVLERAREATAAVDVRVQVDAEQEVVDDVGAALEASDDVRAMARHRTFVVDSGTEFDMTLHGDPDGLVGNIVDRPLRLEGRLPERADEVAVNEIGARQLGLGVGDPMPVHTFAPEDMQALLSDDGFPGFNGPDLDLRVVGVMSTIEDLQGGETYATPQALVSPAFFVEHDDVGGFPEVFDLQMADGAGKAEVDAIATGIVEDADVETVDAEEAYGDSVARAVDVLAVGVLVFTLVAAAAGLLVVAQAAARQVQASSVDDELLAALGLTRSTRTLAAGIPGVLAVLVGTVAAVVGSSLASTFFPIGLARDAEPDPGIRPDLLVALLGAVALALVIGAFVLLRAARRRPTAEPKRSSRLAAALSTPLGGRPVPLIGARLALDPGRGRRAVPVRSAIVGAAVGVLGIVGVAVVVDSLDTLVEEPTRWGWTWSSSPEIEDPEVLRAGLPDDERLEAAAMLDQARVDFGGAEVVGYAFEPLRGEVTMAIREGRAPASAREVALGHGTAEDLGVSIGDTVEATGPDGEVVPLTVTGEAVFPINDNASPGEGALLTPPGMGAVRGSDGFATLVLTYPEGVDTSALERDLAADYGLTFSPYSRPNLPGQVSNLDGLRTLTRALAGFFAALAVVGLAHLLAVSSRRRRLDFAVLRSLGMRRAQVRGSVAVQSLVITVLGLVVGIPAGLVVGRLSWRLMVSDIGVIDDPTQPWAALVGILPAMLVLALVVAAVPAWRSARRRPARVLRAE